MIYNPAKNNSSRSTIKKRVQRSSNIFFAGLHYCAYDLLRKYINFFQCMLCILMNMRSRLLEHMKDTNNKSRARHAIRKFQNS